MNLRQQYTSWLHNQTMKHIDKNPHLKLRVVCDDHRVYTKVVDDRDDTEERYPVEGHKANAALFFKGYSEEFDMTKNDLDETQLTTTDYLATYMQQQAIKQAMPKKTEGLGEDTFNYIMIAGIAVIIVMMFGVL